MEEEKYIVLELSLREAAIISEMAATYSWNHGPYADEVKAISRTLDEHYHHFQHIKPTTVSSVGLVEPAAIWLIDAE